jgi:hypothetical protein
MAVHVLYQDGLAEGRAVMDARAPISVATCAYFEVERTIYLEGRRGSGVRIGGSSRQQEPNRWHTSCIYPDTLSDKEAAYTKSNKN